MKNSLVKELKSFFKFGIVIFVLISTTVGYLSALGPEMSFSWAHFSLFSLGVLFLSSGSLSLNQVQEREADRKMPRTQIRPVAKGLFPTWMGLIISILNLMLGLLILWRVSPLTFYIGLLIVLFYNVFYTMSWKKKMAFAAVPGAIPGALPVVLGYSALSNEIFSPSCIYLFLLMFLWQMPHFWALAMRFKNDYALGGFPVLPLVVGNSRTLFHMTLYMLVYVALALSAPLFLEVNYFYGFVVVPFSLKILYEFYRYYQTKGEKRWLPFFLWTNFSIVIFLAASVLDKWFLVLTGVVSI